MFQNKSKEDYYVNSDYLDEKYPCTCWKTMGMAITSLTPDTETFINHGWYGIINRLFPHQIDINDGNNQNAYDWAKNNCASWFIVDRRGFAFRTKGDAMAVKLLFG